LETDVGSRLGVSSGRRQPFSNGNATAQPLARLIRN